MSAPRLAPRTPQPWEIAEQRAKEHRAQAELLLDALSPTDARSATTVALVHAFLAIEARLEVIDWTLSSS
jgi:hypothetical protein